MFLARARPRRASCSVRPDLLASMIICRACPPLLIESLMVFLTIELVPEPVDKQFSMALAHQGMRLTEGKVGLAL